jgi:hypothetical protein
VGLGARFVLWNKDASGGREGDAMAMGLICPLEHVFLLKFVRSREGQGPVFSFGTGIAPGRRENNGPILSFGNMIAPGGHEGLEASFVLWKQIASGGHEGPGASFVLWKQDCVWRP